MLLVLTLFFASCICATQLHGGSASDEATGFTAMWTALLAVGVSIGGTVIMRKYQSALAIGIFVGIMVIMNFQMLIVFAIMLSHAQQQDEFSTTKSIDSRNAQRAVAGVSFILCFVYGVFAYMLAVFRHDIIRAENYENEDRGRMSMNAHP